MTQILSPNMYTGRRAAIRLIVLHTMEVSESDSRVAESVGRAFASRAREASAHVGVDADSECRYVPDEDTAWAAPYMNADGLQLEMAGRAGQTTGQWKDPASLQILERAAQRVAEWCKKWLIPPVRLTNAQLKAGARGIVDHSQGSKVYGGTHWDVGPRFPWTAFLARVRQILGGVVKTSTVKTVAPSSRIRLDVDGDFGPRTKARLQQWAGAHVDSNLTLADWKTIQRKLGGLVPDGNPAAKTWTAIQKLVGAPQDGDPGPTTYRAMQRWLNTH